MSTPALRLLALTGTMVIVTACSQGPAPEPAGPEVSSASGPSAAGPTSSTTSGTAASSPSSTSTSGRTAEPSARARPTAGATASPTVSCGAVPETLSLRGDEHRAFAFAALDAPGTVTVEGRVADAAAWSTSKVLVIAAYLDTAVDGDPDRIGAANRRLITAALTRSDGDAVVAIRSQIIGRPGAAMTAVLRSIGDRRTVAPEQAQGNMAWSIREQVRFMAALADGRVVSSAVSRYLLESMKPIAEHSWGLGTIGATAYKGGWLRADTATRQLGLVDGYAVAIITDAGPATSQTDGDSAHVQQLNRVARTLRDRLAYEKTCG